MAGLLVDNPDRVSGAGTSGVVAGEVVEDPRKANMMGMAGVALTKTPRFVHFYFPCPLTDF